MRAVDLDNLYDENENSDEKQRSHSHLDEKAVYTERRRRIEDKLEMLRIKREIGIEDDFTFY